MLPHGRRGPDLASTGLARRHSDTRTPRVARKGPDVTSKHPVPVVRLIVPDRSGRVLLLRRANTAYGAGAWCLPGGKVDYGETLAAAVAKELAEETSLRCISSRFLFHQDSLPAEPGAMHCINFYFECRVDGELRLNAESSESAWLHRDAMPGYEIAFRNDEALRRYWSES